MKRIKSRTELKELLDLVEGKKKLSNCYLFFDDLASIVDQSCLYYKVLGNNLFLFKDRLGGQFFEMHYFICDEHYLLDVEHTAPLVIEIPYRGKLKYPKTEVDILVQSGFSVHINRDLMILNKPNFNEKKIVIDNCHVKLLEEIEYALLVTAKIKKTFDFFTGDIVSLEDVQKSIVNKEVLAIYSRNSLAGFLRFYVKNKVSWIGHIVVFDEFAGSGLGKLLVQEYLKHQMDKAIQSFHHWVVSENIAAHKLYEYFGFTKMNKSSISLIKNN